MVLQHHRFKSQLWRRFKSQNQLPKCQKMAAMPPNPGEWEISSTIHSDDAAASYEQYNDFFMDEECALKMQSEEGFTSNARGCVTHADDVRAADARDGGCNDCSMDQQQAQMIQSGEDESSNMQEINRIYIKDEEVKLCNLAQRWAAGVANETESCVTTLDVQCWTPYGECLYTTCSSLFADN